MRKRNLNRLRPQWSPEDVIVTGKTIFEAVPGNHVPDWASTILFYLADGRFKCAELERLIDIGQSVRTSDWINARKAFNAIRSQTLRNQDLNKSNTLDQLILDVGETAAKVIYNASGSSAPYDYHAGWRFAPRVKRVVDVIAEQHVEDTCWQMLTRQSPD